MTKYFYAIILLTIFALNRIQGQTPDSISAGDIFSMSLEEMLQVKINVSSTVPQDVFDSPSTVSVIDRNLIEQFNFQSIAEAVRTVAGVEILQTVIDRNVPTMRGILQNFYANKVLIMIDNIPVWHPTYGNSTLDRLSINDVERIEVLKGPASVLYGTNAYTGIINIILRSPEKSELNAKINAGYPNLASSSLNYFHKKTDFSFNISGSSLFERRNPYLFRGSADTLFLGGVEPNGDPVTLYENDTLYYFQEEYRQYSFNLKLNYKSHSLFLNNFVNSFNNPGINASYLTGANRSITDKGTLISYTYDNELSGKTNLLINTYYDYHFREQNNAQAYEQTARFSSYRIGLIAKINHEFSKYFQAELGTEIMNGHNLGHNIMAVAPDTVIHENIKNEKDITEISLFTQANFNYKWLTILGGARYTKNASFGYNLSPRVTLMTTINKNNVFKFVYGHSFRTPNQLELYFDHWTVVGNPELDPELCQSLEFIYLSRIKDFFGQITFYTSQYTNLIQRIRTSDNISDPAIYQNANEFNSYGLELELKYHKSRSIDIIFNYNMAQGKGENSDNNFNYVPEHTIFFGVSKPINQFFISANLYAYSKVMGPWNEIPKQSMLDSHIGYYHKTEKGLKLTHTISLKNVTNSDMLIPEYIRKRPGVNHLATTGYGRRIVYSMKLSF